MADKANETPTAAAATGQHSSESVGIVNETVILQEIPVCRRTLKSWRDSGKLPHIKIGKRVLYHLPTVRQALLRLQRGGTV
jgi:hypothetical protein